MRTAKTACFAALAAILLITLFGCTAGEGEAVPTPPGVYRGEHFREDMMTPQQGNLYGMCYLYMERRGDADYKSVLRAMYNMGVKSLRTWMHFSYFLSDPETLIEENVAAMREYLAEAKGYGFQIISMNHYNYASRGYFTIGKERRVLADTEGSSYRNWLNDYETSWRTLVSAFPEITYWEIDNELNNPDFMYLDGEKDNVLPAVVMADIAADMLYYGSRGIHAASPGAVTVLGGLVDTAGLGKGSYYNGVSTGTMREFLELLYDRIESGDHGSVYPDDFFQVAAWHPYYYESGADETFVRENNALYEIVKRREGKHKKVFLTEFGWAENHVALERITEWIGSLFSVLEESMPYVESLHYFILFNNRVSAKSGALGGLYYDPREAAADYVLATGEPAAGTPKASAYAYQRAAGGSGDITIC